jgi:hypothetical protein
MTEITRLAEAGSSPRETIFLSGSPCLARFSGENCGGEKFF